GAETRGRLLGEKEILRSGGVLDSLGKLREQGLISHFGITALGEVPSVLNIIRSGRIESAQVYYNLLNPSAGGRVPRSWPVFDFSGILQACDEQGVAAMNIRVFSAGVLATDERTGKEQPLTPGDTVETETEKARRLFSVLGDKHGTRAQTAIRFALAEPRLACVVFGLAEIRHLDEAVAGAVRGALSHDGFDEILEIYESSPSN
ncbi:MAG: aldo/keto reductase, partial [Gammaproteobacteria bacterium]|nr:aldo/keto reductase [Gammaproteobacteria bacterium]